MQQSESQGSGRHSRSRTVDIAKGAAIILVVVGHFSVPGIEPPYWQTLRQVIYLFHMPLFMLLSGYLFGYTARPINTRDDYVAFVKGKVPRLVYPYVSVTLLYLVIKGLAGLFFKFQFPVTPQALRAVLLDPTTGFAPDLWFIYTLFVIFLLFPVFKAVLRFDWLLLAAAVALSWYPAWPAAFCLNYVFHFLPFFICGYIIGRHWYLDALRPRTAGIVLAANLGLFLLAYRVRFGLGISGPNPWWLTLVFGITGSLVCIALAWFAFRRAMAVARPLNTVGLHATIIYLTGTIPASAVGIIAFRALKVPAAMFLPVALLAIAAGVLLPMWIQMRFIKPSSPVARYVLGEGQGRRRQSRSELRPQLNP